MSEDTRVILETKIMREKGYLYPTGTNKDGFVTVMKIKAGRKKKE